MILDTQKYRVGVITMGFMSLFTKLIKLTKKQKDVEAVTKKKSKEIEITNIELTAINKEHLAITFENNDFVQLNLRNGSFIFMDSDNASGIEHGRFSVDMKKRYAKRFPKHILKVIDSAMQNAYNPEKFIEENLPVTL